MEVGSEAVQHGGGGVHGETEEVSDTAGASRARSLSEPKVRQVGFKPPCSPESAAVQEREGEGGTSGGGSGGGGGGGASGDEAAAAATGGGNVGVSLGDTHVDSKPIVHSPAAVIVPTKLNFSSATTTTTTTTTTTSDERGAAADVIAATIAGAGGPPTAVAVPDPDGSMTTGIAVGSPPTTSAILLACSPERGNVAKSGDGAGGSSHECDTPESIPAAVGFSAESSRAGSYTPGMNAVDENIASMMSLDNDDSGNGALAASGDQTSPTKVSPTKVSPTKVSPTKASPTKVSPSRKISPTKQATLPIKSPARSSPLGRSRLQQHYESGTSVPLSTSAASTATKSTSLASESGFERVHTGGSRTGNTPPTVSPGAPTASAGEEAQTQYPKKPKLTKAERRELQNKQRAAKLAAKAGGLGSGGGGNSDAGDVEGQRRGSLKSSSIGSNGGGVTAGGGGGGAGGTGAGSGGAGSVVAAAMTPVKPREGAGKAGMQFDDKKAVAKLAKRAIVPMKASEISFFRHLPEYESSALETFFRTTALEYPEGDISGLPTVILKLGLMYGKGAITGGSNRCVAMLRAFKVVLSDYETPEGKVLVRDFTSHIGKHIQFLQECRPMAAAMRNAIRWLKTTVNKMAARITRGFSQTDEEAKEELLELIDRYIQEKIVFAGKVAARHAATKIRDGDCVLVYNPCQVVMRALGIARSGADTEGERGTIGVGSSAAGTTGARESDTASDASTAGRDFRIVVVDSRPNAAGINVLRTFLRQGIKCNFVTINGIGNVMGEVSKVILSASAVHANGSVLGRAGTSMISMMARSYNKPVMIVCESCKFNENVQCDSFTYNEIGNPERLISSGAHDEGTGGRKAGVGGSPRSTRRSSCLQNYRNDKLSLLNLVYDVTPPEFVTLIVTEFGLVPPTSVPVILRECRDDISPPDA